MIEIDSNNIDCSDYFTATIHLNSYQVGLQADKFVNDYTSLYFKITGRCFTVHATYDKELPVELSLHALYQRIAGWELTNRIYQFDGKVYKETVRRLTGLIQYW